MYSQKEAGRDWQSESGRKKKSACPEKLRKKLKGD